MTEGRLYVCATPIGNLGDITERLRDVLGSVDLVYAEDTRRASKLLSHIGVSVKVRSLFAGNEVERSEELIRRLVEGAKVALLTDAGTPSVSDPGAIAVSMAHSRGMAVTVIPGPSAVVTALALSGFAADRFVFEGFLPRKGSQRSVRISDLRTEQRTTVFFASPHRLADDLADLLHALGPERQVAVTRELTKLHEEVWIGNLGEAADRWSGEVKGEVTVVIAPAVASKADLESAISDARSLVKAGKSISEAAKEVAQTTGASRREIYERLLEK